MQFSYIFFIPRHSNANCLIGGDDLIEVGHPAPGEGEVDPRGGGLAVLHLGPVGAGKQVSNDDQLRQEFAYKVK